VNVASDEFARLLSEKSGGLIKIDRYYNAVLGNDREVVEQVAGNMLDMCVAGIANAVGIIPEVGILDLPYLFKSNEHVQAVLKAGIMGEFAKFIEQKANAKVLAWFESGWREVYNTKRPIRDVKDFSGIKIRIQENNVFIDMYEAVGAIPTPMASSEVYTAIQQGTIDGVDNGIFPMYLNHYADFGGYISLTNHAYGYSPLLISLKVWNSLTEEQQALFEECAAEAQDYAYVVAREIEADAIKSMTSNSNVQIIEDVDTKAISEAMGVIYDKYIEKYGDFGSNLIARIKALSVK